VPEKNSYDVISLPDKLYVYETDRLNRVNSILKNDDGDAVISTLETDEIFNEETRYIIDITSYINRELADAYFDYNHGLLIGLSQDKQKSSLGRLIIENKNPRVKLRLYYLSY
jgi:hypothetical protein